MIERPEKALLPAGLRDLLPPDAAFEAAAVERLLESMAAFGYQRVKPPLLEFEDSLLAGSGAALADQAFRLMDPVSQRMLAVRPDMTMQVARVAASRLSRAPRPLRLAYAGQVVRVRGSQLRPERQFTQVGAEIIGAPTPGADAEVILMAVTALRDLGVTGLSVDLGVPTLVPALLGDGSHDPEAAAELRAALDRKDTAAVRAMGPAVGETTASTLTDLVSASGPAEAALSRLDGLRLPDAAAAERAVLKAVFDRIRAEAPDLTVTIDPVESRGFEYHTGITFTVFASGVRGELGSGGRYRAADGTGGEPATGVSLFMDSIGRAFPPPKPPRMLFAPCGTAGTETTRLRADGWIVVTGLVMAADPTAEARRLGCTHIVVDDDVQPLASEET